MLVILVVDSLPVHSQERQRRALFLFADSDIPAVGSVREGVRKKLAMRPPLEIRTFNEFLDLSRFPHEAHKQRAVRYLTEKYAETKLDVVMALGPDALRIAVDNRSVLAPGVPIVFCCVSPSTLSAIEHPTDVTGIVSEFNVAKTMELARRLQPTARNLVVIAGAAPFDLRWVEIARNQIDREWQFSTRYLVGLKRETLLSEVGKLSPNTIVIMLTMFRDGAGHDFIPSEVAEEVAKASSAPMYSPYARPVGRGFVGGYSDTYEDIGLQTGELILRILNGEDIRQIPPGISTTQAFRVDARQLERWNLAESNLPANTVIGFKKPGLWDQHRSAVLGTIAVFVAASAVIALLLIQISKRRRAESHLRDSEERLGFAAASAGIGLWQYDIGADRLWSSERCRLMFGLPANYPLTTVELLRTVHPDDRAVAIASIRAATYGTLADGVSEFRVLQPDGQVRWVQARGRTSVNDEGRPVLVSGIFRDVTGYRAAQLEAKQLSERVLNIQDEERGRIAQELHDSTAQHLTSIGLNLVALAGPNGSRRKSSKIFADIEKSLEEASRELRTFTYLLHPPELARDGLVSTLRRYIEGFSRRTGLGVALRSDGGADKLPQALQHSLMRIVQECLANVHRHASASRATVHLRRVGDRLHLVVTDDGRGLPSERGTSHGKVETLPAGVGIAGMSARLRHFGGKLDIRSSSTGTTVHVVVPIAINAPESARTQQDAAVNV